jgi:predicted hydrocarbon binding protein
MKLEDQQINGENFLHLEDFIKYKWGTNGLETYKKESPLKFESVMKDKLYPLKDYILSLEIIQSLFENDNLAFEIGWHRARNLLLAKGKNKQGIELLSKVVIAWNKFNNFGDLTIINSNENEMTLKMSNYTSHELYCLRMQGFFSGIVCMDKNHLEAINKVKCVNNGDDSCEFLIKTAGL